MPHRGNIKMDIETLRTLKMKLDEAKYLYDTRKLDLEITKLTLKYSPEYEKYKTIKEKEERAKLETRELAENLLIEEKIVRDCATEYEIANLIFLYEDENECEREQDEPQ